MRRLKYGGDLLPGDFIAISFSNCLDFGWYVGNGIGNTLQYYTMRGPSRIYRDYESWLNMSDEEKAKHTWQTKRFEKGFTRKCLWKSYINSVHDTRVMRLTDVEDVFTEQEDIEDYQKSREVLIKVNLIKED